jgi:hypothetical protein
MAQGVEIASEIDRAVHPAGLLGGHICERPGDHLRRRRGLAFPWQTRGDAKAGKPGLAGDGIHQNIRRLDVLMDEAALVNLSKGRGETDGEGQEASQRHRLSEQPMERLAAGVLEHKQAAPTLAQQLQRPRGPRAGQLVLQSIFVSEAIEVRGCGGFCGENDHQHRYPAAVSAITPPAAEDAFAVLPQGSDVIFSILRR